MDRRIIVGKTVMIGICVMSALETMRYARDRAEESWSTRDSLTNCGIGKSPDGLNQKLSRELTANHLYQVVDVDRFISAMLPKTSPELVIVAVLCFSLALGSIYLLERTRRQGLEKVLLVAVCAGATTGYALGATSLQTLLVYLPWSFVVAVIVHQMLGVHSQDPVRHQARTWTEKNDQGELHS